MQEETDIGTIRTTNNQEKAKEPADRRSVDSSTSTTNFWPNCFSGENTP
jgi:hypothetical protein